MGNNTHMVEDDETAGRAALAPPLFAHPHDAIPEAELAHAPEDVPEPAAARWRALLTPYAAISAGGLLGANARYLAGQWAARWPGPFPWGTLLINVTGSLVLGFFLTLVTERFIGRAVTRLFVATGFLGAYTTFSTFGVETITLAQHHLYGDAIAYVATSLVLGLAAVVAGAAAARAM
jgi:fluoride exporter